MLNARSSVGRLAAGTALSALAVAALAACSSKSGGGTASGSTSKTLTIAETTTNSSLDPITSIGAMPGLFVEAAYDPLIQQRTDGSFAPDLATTFGYVGSDNKTYKLTLRSGVKFSDGAALTADGVKAWIERMAGSPGTYQNNFKNISSVHVDGPLELTLHLTDADPKLNYELSQQYAGFPVSPDALKTPKVLEAGTYGAGPYMLDKGATVLGTKFTYVQNPNYWNKARQHWEKVVFSVVPNGNAALSAVQTGQATIATVSPQLASSVGNSVNLTHVPTYFAGLDFLDRGGVVVPALRDVRVRQAIAYALDRTAITKNLFGKYGTPSVQGLVQGNAGYTPGLDDAFTYDPTQAKQLLAAAGYPNGFTLPIAVIPFGATGQESALAQAIAGYLNAVGIKTELKPYPDLGSGFADAGAKKVAVIPEVSFYAQDIDVIVPVQLLPGSVINPFTETPEKEFVALYNAAEKATGSERTTALQKLQTYVVKNALDVHTSVLDTIYVTSKSLAPLDVSGVVPIVNLADLKPAK